MPRRGEGDDLVVVMEGRASAAPDARLQISSLLGTRQQPTLAQDVIEGLTSTPKWLPPKHFYDERGSELFEQICDTPEYYVTRSEEALIAASAPGIFSEVAPDMLVELGSGGTRKTRLLLDSMSDGCYVPVDISEDALLGSANEIVQSYPRMRVHGVVADFEQCLRAVPQQGRRLIAFLGGTIGNFEVPEAVRLLSRIAEDMAPEDALLLGMDQVKSEVLLRAAYNDAAGVTAEFNRNVLHVINRELDANFEPEAFEHVAVYRPELRQVEMQLCAHSCQRVEIRGLGMTVRFAQGERLRTEISRKYTRETGERLVRAAGLRLRGWYTSPDGYFAHALAVRA